jgi:multidrug efflux system outer membrane protein
MVALDGKLQLIFLAIAFALSEGCALGPDYKRPSMDVPVSFRSQESTGRQALLADLPWWEVFKDPDLKDLITTALVNNYDLRMAISRIEQARAIETQVRSPLFPQFDYQFEVSGGRNSTLGRATPGIGSIQGSALGLLNASWELDLWGRIRRADEAARAQILASEEAKRGVMLSLVSDVAQNIFSCSSWTFSLISPVAPPILLAKV